MVNIPRDANESRSIWTLFTFSSSEYLKNLYSVITFLHAVMMEYVYQSRHLLQVPHNAFPRNEDPFKDSHKKINLV